MEERDIVEELKGFINARALDADNKMKSLVKQVLVDSLKEVNHHAGMQEVLDAEIELQLITLVSLVCNTRLRDAIRAEIDIALPRAFDLLKTVNQLEDARIQEILAETLHRTALKLNSEVKEKTARIGSGI